MTFSPDGKTVASAGGKTDKTIRLWDVANGALLKTLTGHTSLVECIAFSPDGLTLASAGDDGTVGLWALVPPKRTLASISPTPAQPLKIGDLLTFSLNISSERVVVAYQAIVEFDATVLRYVSSRADYLPNETFFVPPVVSGNRVKLATYTLSHASIANRKLTTLTFEVIAIKPIEVRLSEVLITDGKGHSFRPRIEKDR